MEHDATVASAVTRNQNVVYVLPRDTASMAQVLTPVLERIDEQLEAVQVVIVTTDAESALAIVRTVMRLTAGRAVAALPATSVSRATRVLRARPPHVIAASPAALLALVQAAVLKFDATRAIVLAWVDEALAAGDVRALESVMADVPKEAARILVASHMSTDGEALAERYLRRARRITTQSAEDAEPIDIQYVSVTETSRPATLRRLLDALDPERAAVFVRSDDAASEVDDVLHQLGYHGGVAQVQVTRGEGADAPLVILYELPASRHAISAVTADGPRTLIALAPPRQLPVLRALAAGGRVIPYTLPEPAQRARSAEDVVRAELRSVLADGAPARELLTLEPLLEDFDGIELAAATLRLLERERESARAAAHRAAPAVRPPAASSGDWTRLFVNVGARDHARPGDLMGAITGEAGIAPEQVGKIELRDSHSLVDIATPVAEQVVGRLTGATVRGRRVVARIDTERPGGGPRPGSRERGGRSADRGRPRGGDSRPARGGRTRAAGEGSSARRERPRGEGREAREQFAAREGRPPRRHRE